LNKENISLEAGISQSEDIASEKDDLDKNVIENQKEIVSSIPDSSKTSQILIQRDDKDEDDYSLSVTDFRTNDNKILSLLNQEDGSNYYSFKGLMRKLHIHQQSLSRALNRLQDLGMIEKSTIHSGYKLTKKGESVLSKSGSLDLEGKRNTYSQLILTYIPINVKANEIADSLIGRWFNNFRWVSLIEGGTGYALQWVNEDDSFQVSLKIVSDYIIIETNAVSDKEKIEAMAVSYRIFQHVTKLFQNKLGEQRRFLVENQYYIQRNYQSVN
jgi:DNA-binding HxlR family transcriptional regulator